MKKALILRSNGKVHYKDEPFLVLKPTNNYQYRIGGQHESFGISWYCQIKFATLDSVYHVTLPVYPVI